MIELKGIYLLLSENGQVKPTHLWKPRNHFEKKIRMSNETE